MPEQDEAFTANRLIAKGLHHTNPHRDVEYQALIGMWQSQPEFRQVVLQCAKGLGLEIIDVSNQGIVLSPADSSSLFAMTPVDYQKALGDTSSDDRRKGRRALLALVQVAVAAAFFPTARHLLDVDASGRTTTVMKIREILLELVKRIKEDAQNDPAKFPPAFRHGWEEVERLPAVREGENKAGFASLTGIIHTVLNHLAKARMVVFEKTGDDGFYFATRKYHALLAYRASSQLFELCYALVQDPREEK